MLHKSAPNKVVLANFRRTVQNFMPKSPYNFYESKNNDSVSEFYKSSKLINQKPNRIFYIGFGFKFI